MVTVIVLIFTFALATFGFLVMQNPMRIVWIAPRGRGYYQRVFVDATKRLQLRGLGMIFSFVGLMISTGILSSVYKTRFLDALANGMLVLLWISFVGGFAFGTVYLIVQIFRRGWKQAFLGSLIMQREARRAGPFAADPAVTPRIQMEANISMAVYCFVMAVVVVAAFVNR